MKIYRTATELTGNTPLLEISGFARENALDARLLAKLEFLNPWGSVKDRVAREMTEDAEKSGKLAPGATIIEPTSGNTGIALAAVAAAKGYGMIAVMPETMSVERQNLLKAYGARVVTTPGALGMKGAVDKANELASSIDGAILAGQFVNPSNPKAHYKTTGPEIFRDTDGKLDFFIAGVGTGGTLTGAGRFLKERIPTLKVVAVEPEGCATLSGGKPGAHAIQGIGAGFVPDTLDGSVYDEVIAVSDGDAFACARMLARTDAVLAGISGGAALFAAKIIAERTENRGKTIALILPDSADRYFSTPLFGEA